MLAMINNNLAWRYVKATPKRSVLTIFGISMALAMMMCIGNAISTILDSSRRELYERFGTWETMFSLEGSDLNENDISALDKVEETAAIYERAKAYFPQLREEGVTDQEWLAGYDKGYISTSENITEMMNLDFAEGSFPANDSEVAITRSLAEMLDVKLGDAITMQVGQRREDGFYTDEDGYEMTSFSFEGTERSHKVSGIIDDASGKNQGLFSGSQYVVTGPNSNKPSLVLTKFTKGTNVVLRSEEIASELQISGNEMEINNAVYTNDFSSMLTQMFMISVIFLFCCALVAFAAISIVRNSFSMSVTERMRDYGLLRCAGATQQQIKRLIRNEVIIMLAVAFPLSLIISYVASAGVLSIVNGMQLMGIPHLYLTVSWFFILLSMGVALLSVIIAVVGPSKKAASVSPILITTGQDDAETIQTKAVAKKSKLGKVLGIEWELASRNRRAAGKRSRTTVFSMSVSVGLLLATAGMMQTYLLPSMQDAESEIDIIAEMIQHEDEEMSMTDEEFKEYRNEAANMEGVLAAANMKQVNLYGATVDKANVENADFIEQLYDSRKGDIAFRFRINFIGREVYQTLQQENSELAGMDYDAWAASGGAILNDYVKASLLNDYGRELKSSRQNLFRLKEGERLELTLEDVDVTRQYDEQTGTEIVTSTSSEEDSTFGWSVNIGKKIKNRCWFDDMYSAESTPIIYLPEQAADENMALLEKADGYGSMMLLLQTDPKLNPAVADALIETPGISVHNLYESEITLRNVIVLLSICVYSFVGVIALISCLNIINIISTNLVLRRRDFGLLQAVGMNVKQMRKMIVLECVQFSIRSMVYGSILGFIALVGLHFVMTMQASTQFYINPLTVLLIFAGCFMVSIIASWPTWKKMKKVSIMESVRHLG